MGETREKPCPECGTKVEVEPIQVLGRTISPAVLCPSCAGKHEDVQAGESTEDSVRRKLEVLGINVPARGRFPLHYVLERVPVDAQRVRRFVEETKRAGRWEPVRGLILEGPTGVGKSWLLAGIMRELVETGAMPLRDMVYDSSRKVWGLIKSGYGDGTANAEIERRMRCRFWGLDDLGAEHPNDDTGLNFTEILTARELRPTVITANIPRDSDVQAERFDPMVWDRIKSRLADRNFDVLQIVGRDWRTAA